MIIIDDTIVSEELFDVHFVCDLPACLGACCVEGDAGAPLEEGEARLLEKLVKDILPFMTPEGRLTLEKEGVFAFDQDGVMVTPLNGGRECAFVYFENGQARCAIEKAWSEERIPFRKPVSCHLYPVRLGKLGDHIAVNYHRWHICEPARDMGRREGVPLYVFLKDPLVRRFGEDWYARLEIAARYYLSGGTGH